jgi:hypothetical protein
MDEPLTPLEALDPILDSIAIAVMKGDASPLTSAYRGRSTSRRVF